MIQVQLSTLSRNMKQNETVMSKAGKGYTSASGGTIRNYGGRLYSWGGRIEKKDFR